MGLKSLYSELLCRLHSSELFVRPSKLIIGRWQLFEYFIDEDKELKHWKEEQLLERDEILVITFLQDGDYRIVNSVPIPLLEVMTDGRWSVTKNFVSLYRTDDFRGNVEFQFAINKGVFKMLKKDAFGNIEFFGFFKRMEPVPANAGGK